MTQPAKLQGFSCDLLVIGAGPAGIACALQAARTDLRLAVVSDEPAGGLIRAAHRIDNLPGYPPGVPGAVLAEAMARQLEAAGIALTAAHIDRLARQPAGFVAGAADGRAWRARAVVLATGTAPKPWQLSGLDELIAAGRAFRDVRPLPANLTGAAVLIIGGGEAALDSALSVRQRGGRPVVALRSAAPRAAAKLLREVRAAGVPLRTGCLPAQLALSGDGIVVRWPQAHCPAERERFDYVLGCLGRHPRSRLLEGCAPGAQLAGRVTTAVPGLFLAGDLLRERDRFIALALGDGQRAAVLATQALRAR